MAVKKLIFDIMLNDRFVCTMRMPITFDMIDDYNDMGGDNRGRDKRVLFLLSQATYEKPSEREQTEIHS